MCNKTYDSKTCCDGQAAILLRDEVRLWSGGLDGQVEPAFHVSVQKHDQDNDQTIIEQSSTEKLHFFITSSVVKRTCQTSSTRLACVCSGSFHHISDHDMDLI